MATGGRLGLSYSDQMVGEPQTSVHGSRVKDGENFPLLQLLKLGWPDGATQVGTGKDFALQLVRCIEYSGGASGRCRRGVRPTTNSQHRGLRRSVRSPSARLKRGCPTELSKSELARTWHCNSSSVWNTPTEPPLAVDEDFALLRVLYIGDSDGVSPVKTCEETVTVIQEVPYTEYPTDPHAARCYRATAA